MTAWDVGILDMASENRVVVFSAGHLSVEISDLWRAG